MFGPWLAPPGNSTIQIAPVANRAVAAGVPLSITVAATDPNLPPLPLSFSLLSYPNGASINPTNGVFTWRPSVAQANTTNLVTVQAADNMTPSLTGARSFQITVNPVAQPTLGGIVLTNGQFIFQASAITAPTTPFKPPPTSPTGPPSSPPTSRRCHSPGPRPSTASRPQCSIA